MLAGMFTGEAGWHYWTRAHASWIAGSSGKPWRTSAGVLIGPGAGLALGSLLRSRRYWQGGLATGAVKD
ncbi:hypothetical protein [Streptomyces sp. NPDC000878]